MKKRRFFSTLGIGAVLASSLGTNALPTGIACEITSIWEITT